MEYKFQWERPNCEDFSNDKDLIDKIKDLDNSKPIDLLLVIISGPKQNNRTYNEVKQLTLSEIQIPTQIVNVQTISKGKNLRSIINRILMQINWKVGGAPWGISDIPYDEPMMIMGLSIWKKNQKSQHSILCCTSTVNRRLNQYITICKEVKGDDSYDRIKEWIDESIKNFGKINKKSDGSILIPKKIIVYRDGLSDSQQKLAINYEIPAIKEVLVEYKNTKFTYFIANKKVSWRFFESNKGSINSAGPGMVIDHTITSKASYSNFYMVSQIARQGAASPSHYHILYSDEDLSKEKSNLIKLTYKLWYLYFHINSGIKLPAPIQYAERWGALLGEKVNSRKDSDFVLPGKRFLNKTSLFYI